MGIHKCYHALNDFILLSFIKPIRAHEIGAKHLINISAHGHFNFSSRDIGQTLLLELRILLEVLQVLGLVVLVHGPEAGPEEKEVELLCLLNLDHAHFRIYIY